MPSIKIDHGHGLSDLLIAKLRTYPWTVDVRVWRNPYKPELLSIGGSWIFDETYHYRSYSSPLEIRPEDLENGTLTLDEVNRRVGPPGGAGSFDVVKPQS